jgi:hypothetical protein
MSHVGVTIDGVWIREWIYSPLIHMTRKYKLLQRHRQSPQIATAPAIHYCNLLCLHQLLPDNGY